MMTDGQSDVISARVRQITFGALLATHAFEKCFDPKDWVEAAKHPLALAEMKNMRATSIGVVAAGVTSESEMSRDAATNGPVSGTPRGSVACATQYRPPPSCARVRHSPNTCP